jgi:hypothetical protein
LSGLISAVADRPQGPIVKVKAMDGTGLDGVVTDPDYAVRAHNTVGGMEG